MAEMVRLLKSMHLRQLSSAAGWFVFAFLLLAGARGAHGRQFLGQADAENGKLSVKIESLFSDLPSHGYLPLRVNIQNKTGRAVALRIETSARYNRYWQGENTFDASFQVSAEAGQEAEHEILAPVFVQFPDRHGYGGGNMWMSVRVSGPGLSSRQFSMHSNNDGDLPCVALSTESGRLQWDDVRNSLAAVASSRSGPGGSGGDFGVGIEPESMASSWRAYAGFDMMIFRGDEWSEVMPTARAAVLDWVRMGGRLIFWNKGGATPTLAEMGIEGVRDGKLGLGSVVVSPPQQDGNGNPVSVDLLVEDRFGDSGFTGILASDYDPTERSDIQGKDQTSDEWALMVSLGKREFKAMQVVIILIAFGIVVGPVNLFVLARFGKRHRLFFTTPLISVGASLLIAALIFFQDGLGGDGVRASVTFLDPVARKAYTTQEQVARTGVLTGRSFSVEEPMVLSPVMMERTRWTFVHESERFGAGGSLAYDLAGTTFSGDWFRSRSEQGHFAQMVKPTRESVQVLAAERGAGGEPVILSSLGIALEKLVYIDDGGKVWTGENIATGGKATLDAWESAAFRLWWRGLRDSLGDSLGDAVARASDSEATGRFYALAANGGAATMIETLGAIRWKNERALLFGNVETIGKGGPSAP